MPGIATAGVSAATPNQHRARIEPGQRLGAALGVVLAEMRRERRVEIGVGLPFDLAANRTRTVAVELGVGGKIEDVAVIFPQ